MPEPLTNRKAINRAVALNVIDAVTAACLGVACGADDAAWLDMLTSLAFLNRYTQTGSEAHKEMCVFNDAWCAETTDR